ncbi:hypothetical protein CJ030_MR1G005024 [Morella rubra]|uniref:DUF4216 domain-containing protein n=1 Tax=Morella rubra TaxID=262757 RepID=A0A6A1WRQ5_9ROSI|nr:hypothetical protein CJ030_MR1G005024 [Morella rubra]
MGVSRGGYSTYFKLSQESGASLPYSDDDLEGDNSDRMEEMLTDVRAGLDGGAARVETENPNIKETPTWGPKASTPLNKLWEEAEHELYPGCTKFNHRGIRNDKNFKSINTSRLWYLEDPFVLANQASQVFYLVDNLHGPTWRVVQKLSCRNAYDIPGLDPDGEVDVNIESGAAITNEAYQEDDAIDLFIDFRQFNLNPLRRDDVTPNVIQASEAIDRRKKRPTSASKRGRGRTRGVGLEKSLGSGSGKLSVHIPEGECGGVSSTAATLSTKIGMLVRGLIPISVNKWVDVPAEVKEYIMDRVLDHFDLDYTRQEDVRTVVETMMTARRTHRNRMHAYFKKFPSKEAALLKPHPDTTEEQWKELCDLFTSEAFMKRSEQNKKNRSKLTVNHAAGSRSFQRTRACMKNQESGKSILQSCIKELYKQRWIWTSEGAREIYEWMDAFQCQCDLEGKTYTEIEVYSEILGKKSGYVRGLGRG